MKILTLTVKYNSFIVIYKISKLSVSVITDHDKCGAPRGYIQYCDTVIYSYAKFYDSVAWLSPLNEFGGQINVRVFPVSGIPAAEFSRQIASWKIRKWPHKEKILLLYFWRFWAKFRFLKNCWRGDKGDFWGHQGRREFLGFFQFFVFFASQWNLSEYKHIENHLPMTHTCSNQDTKYSHLFMIRLKFLSKRFTSKKRHSDK